MASTSFLLIDNKRHYPKFNNTHQRSAPASLSGWKYLTRITAGLLLLNISIIGLVSFISQTPSKNVDKALAPSYVAHNRTEQLEENIQLPILKTITVNGMNLEYTDVGEGDPIVLVHGATSGYRTWPYYLLPVSGKHRYISYSRRHYSSQSWPGKFEKWSGDTAAVDLIEFIEILDIGPVHLVTWSSGGISATLVAIQRPDLVKSAAHHEPVAISIMPDNTNDDAR